MRKTLMQKIISSAQKSPKRIVLAEGEDERVIKAAVKLQKQKIAFPILIGRKSSITTKAKKLGVDISGITIVDPKKSELAKKYAEEFYVLRKHKKMTRRTAIETLKNEVYFGTMMVQMGNADGIVSGATHPTADTLRPALQIFKTIPGITTASSYFIMMHEKKPYFFGDCGFVIDPDAQQLAEIAISTADSAKQFGITPRIAMLSFSTKGSAEHPLLDKIINATNIVKKKRKDLIIDGELQFDAAFVPTVAKSKCPTSPIKGKANVFIFPDLNAANIAYKIAQRFAHDTAIGPIVQGTRKPVNDLSRGCSTQDIIEVAAITVIEAQRI